MFVLVELTSKPKIVGQEKSYKKAINRAMEWSAKTGLSVEIQTEKREVIDTIRSWAERDYHD